MSFPMAPTATKRAQRHQTATSGERPDRPQVGILLASLLRDRMQPAASKEAAAATTTETQKICLEVRLLAFNGGPQEKISERACQMQQPLAGDELKRQYKEMIALPLNYLPLNESLGAEGRRFSICDSGRECSGCWLEGAKKGLRRRRQRQRRRRRPQMRCFIKLGLAS